MLLNPDPTSRWKPSMRTHLTALCVLGAALVSACGGGSDSAIPRGPPTNPPPTNPPPTNPPPTTEPPPSAPQLDATVLKLYESALVHGSLAASSLDYLLDPNGNLWTPTCARASLDGAPPAPPVLPTGTHTLVTTFTGCFIDLLVGTALEGTASATYTTTDFNHLVAQVSASSMQLRGGSSGELYYVTADGSGTWTRVWTNTEYDIAYTPAIGSKLINDLTGNVATFEGGAYSSVADYTTSPAEFYASGQEEFDNLTIAIDGINYILHGSIHVDYAFSASNQRYGGEVRVTRGGSLVARIYGDANGKLRTEVLSPLTPF